MACVAASLFLAMIWLIWLAVKPFFVARGWKAVSYTHLRAHET